MKIFWGKIICLIFLLFKKKSCKYFTLFLGEGGFDFFEKNKSYKEKHFFFKINISLKIVEP